MFGIRFHMFGTDSMSNREIFTVHTADVYVIHVC